MSSVSSLAPAAVAPVVTAAPFLGGSAAPVTAALASLGSNSISGVQADLDAAIQLSEATPQQLALLAANGDQRAQRILARAEASRRLLSPVDLTV